MTGPGTGESTPQPQPPTTEAAPQPRLGETTIGPVIPQIKSFVEHGAHKSKAYGEIGKRLDFDSKIELADDLDEGLSRAHRRIKLLHNLERHPDRVVFLDRLKNVRSWDPWTDFMENWKSEEDPGGIKVLRAKMKQDIESIRAQKNDQKTPDENNEIELSAQAEEAGQSLVIDYHEYQLKLAGVIKQPAIVGAEQMSEDERKQAEQLQVEQLAILGERFLPPGTPKSPISS